MENKWTQVIAHRGGYYEGIKENTLPAFQKAIEIGVDFIDLDVQQTKDGKLVVIHEREINGKKITELTYEELLAETEKYAYQAPLLWKVIDLAKGKVKLDIEVKSPGYEKELVYLLTGNLNCDQFMIKSSDDDVIRKIKEIDNRITTGLLVKLEKNRSFTLTGLAEILSLKKRMEKTGVDFIFPHFYFMQSLFGMKLKKMEKPIYVWTVNEKRRIKKFFKKGVEGIITDKPEIALKIRNEKN